MATSTSTDTCFVSHLESAIDGTRFERGTIQTMHADRPLWVKYDLKAVGEAISRSDLAKRENTLWRYRELLPVESSSHIVSLGETITPILPCPQLGEKLGLPYLYIKDESRLPTGSFKARGMAMAVSMAKSLGINKVAAPTAGNAGGALAAYAARAGMECYVFMPRDTPIVNQLEAVVHGAKAYLINGLITDCGRIVNEGKQKVGWFDMSTLKEPYRIEGKKTMGLELAEQFNWKLPDVVLYPTGGGTGLIGMWKAWAELTELGWLDSNKLPRLFACQSSGCAPIPTAFDSGERFATPTTDPHTIASGLRVPKAVGDFMILDAVRESGGMAMAAEEDNILKWMRLACETEGIALCPEAAACIGVAERSIKEGIIKPDESVVIFNTGAVQKYVEALKTDLPELDCSKPIDFDRIVG